MTEPLAVTARARIPWRMAEVLAIVGETPRAKSLVLNVPGWPGHLAGQHVDVRLTADDGYQAERSYSIASPPEQKEVVLTVERIDDGEVSPFLTGEATVGDRFELRGPIGRYFTWSPQDGGPLQLVAGGSGVVPLMAMIRHRARNGDGTVARLLYSSRTRDVIIYRDELDRLAGSDDRLGVVYTLTRESVPGWQGRTGRVDRAMLDAVAFAPELKPHVYICGPTPFVENVANLLVAQGHPPGRVKTERFGPTGGT